MRGLGETSPLPLGGLGETGPVPLRSADSNMIRLMAQRKAVNVLPLPVGARINVDSPRAMAGQPSLCGGVGASKEARNQSATAPWKRSSTTPRLATCLFSLYLHSALRLLYS